MSMALQAAVQPPTNKGFELDVRTAVWNTFTAERFPVVKDKSRNSVKNTEQEK